VKGVDPETASTNDDTKRYIDAIDWVSRADKEKIFQGNVKKVYSALQAEGPKR